MNAKEEKKLLRIQMALGAIPGPAGGTQSTTVRGLGTYAYDMKFVQERLYNAIYMLRCPDPDYTQKEQEEEFDNLMKEVEDFIERRKQENWQ